MGSIMHQQPEPLSSSTATIEITIPDKYKPYLELLPHPDQRTDAEIATLLTTNTDSFAQASTAPDAPPPTPALIPSEKNIWAFWHAGFAAMPAWCQRNVTGWSRLNPSWSIRVLDNIPTSPFYALRYVPPSLLPASFVARTMSGPFAGPHMADMLRGACLHAYGGVWLDVGAVLTRGVDRVAWDVLVDPATPFEVAAPHMYEQAILNHFIAARRGSEFIRRWHALFVHCWEGRESSDGLIDHPLLREVVPAALEKYREQSEFWDWKVGLEKAAEYVTQIICWWRVAVLEDAGDGFSGVDFWMNKTYLFNLVEDWPAEVALGFGTGFGDKLFAVLDMDRAGDPGVDAEAHRAAEELVWGMLTRACMQKVTHGAALTHSKQLGTLWDEEENLGRDCRPGTFGELLRVGAVRFRQTRASIVAVEPPRPAQTFRKGLLEV